MKMGRIAVIAALAWSCWGVQAETTIRIDPSAKRHQIAPLLFGTNIQWEKNGDQIFDAGTARIDERVLAEVRALGIRGIRFPGGDLANTYRWKDGIGPQRQRKEGRSYSGARVASTFGTTEFMELLKHTDTTPIVTVNLSASADEAADWVEYFNGTQASAWGRLRASNGQPLPRRVVYWEMGNELFSPHQPGHADARAYAKRARAVATAMRARDPTIKIGVSLEASFTEARWVPKVLPHLVHWNETVLQEVGHEIDFVVLHFYAPHDTLWRSADLRMLTLAGPQVLQKSVAHIKALLTRYARPSVELALTEFGTAYGDKFLLSKRIAGTDSALFTALVLFVVMREPGFVLANHWSLLNNGQYGMLVSRDGATPLRRPVYEVYRLLAQFQGMRFLEPTADSAPVFAVSAKGSVPALAKVPLVEAIAGVGEDGGVVVALVNNDAEKTSAVSIEFPSGSPRRYAMTSEVVSAEPSAARWRAARVERSTHVGTTFKIALPAHALMRVSFEPVSQDVRRKP